ncbi:uncharacterized protein LOC127096021 [Lathyrus oleraceus]|uniref:uncharacterized protein LOC127096021 n=1 Tax=Pisum sativum TaxID=3888 RepID=UPI0021D2B7B5|nr:uncharacterized protein LOC127096021 [Pisum sativum]
MTYTDLLPSLLTQNLIEKRVAPLVPDKLPRWYKPNEQCAFHSDASGHDTGFVFKGKIHELVRLRMIKLSDMPNVATNPLPENVAVNMITEDENLIMDVMKVKTPLMPVHLKLFKVSGKKMNDEVSVIVSVIMSIFNKPKAFKIFCPPRESTPPANSAKRLDIKMPAHFPYKSDKVVLWGYETTIIVNGVEKPLFNNKVVTNIADTSGLTRSGRVFTLANLRGGKTVAEKLDNGKAPLVIPESIPIQDVKAKVFLHLIGKSDYKVVDQILQTQSKIYVMSFLLNSEVHLKALLKVLVKAYVNPDVTVDQLYHVVRDITSCNTLSFFDNEFPAEGKKHNNSLYISLGYEKGSLSHVLVDIVSSLNVMPKITLSKLSYIGADIRPSKVVVKAFDGSRRTVMGEIVLRVMVGPHQYIDVKEDTIVTQFQGLEITNVVRIEDLDEEDKIVTSMASLKDAQQVVGLCSAQGRGVFVWAS